MCEEKQLENGAVFVVRTDDGGDWQFPAVELFVRVNPAAPEDEQGTRHPTPAEWAEARAWVHETLEKVYE